MDFARQQRDPTKHLIGISLVILFHVIVIWLLVTGLAHKAVELIKKPLNATIVEEIKVPPPPPPPPKKVELPKVPPPQQQPYIPPPDVPPPVTQAEPVIAAVTATPPTTPPVIAPPAPPAPPPPAKPAIRKGIIALSKVDPIYPKQAILKGIESGRVVAHAFIDEKGNVTEVKIIEAEPPKYFDRAVIDALMQWKFAAEGEKFVGEIEVNFRLQ